MAWTSPRTWVAGEKPSASTMNTHIRDNFKAIGDAWTAYTPTWTADTTNPALGNGTIAGRYLAAGKFVQGSIRIRMGSTTTFGSGPYVVTLPVAALTTGDEVVGTVIVTDASPSNHYGMAAYLRSSTTIALVGTDGVHVKSTTPITFATNDVIAVTFCYEAA